MFGNDGHAGNAQNFEDAFDAGALDAAIAAEFLATIICCASDKKTSFKTNGRFIPANLLISISFGNRAWGSAGFAACFDIVSTLPLR